MIALRLAPQLKWVALAALLTAVAVGCSKKQPVAAAPATPAAEETAAAPAPAAAQAAAEPAPAAPDPATLQPAAPPPVVEIPPDPAAAMAEAQAAQRARDYQKAVAMMLAIQQAQLSAQQAAMAHNQMVNLQRNLANAIASGDPNALAAAQALRASASGGH